MTVVIILKNYHFRIIIKNLTKCNILSTFALTIYGKFTHIIKKNCVLGPWPRTLCPRLHLRSNRTQCCQRLATAATFPQKELCCPATMTLRWAPPTRYTLQRNAASIMKDLITCTAYSMFNTLRQHMRSHEFNSAVKCWISGRNSSPKLSL